MKKKNIKQILIITLLLFLSIYSLFSQENDNALIGDRSEIKTSAGYKQRTQIQMIEDNDDTDRAEEEMSFDGFPKRDFIFVFNYSIFSTYPGTITMESAMMITVKATNYPITFMHKNASPLIQVITYFAKSILVDIPIIHAATTFNHEFFGHAVRVREAGGTVDKVHINWPFPFGGGGGYTEFHGVNSTDHNLMVISGGYEANMLMSHIIAMRWVKDGYIAPHDFTSYFLTRLDLFYYINATENLNSSDGNDIVAYVKKVNEKYGFNTESTYALSLDDLQKYKWIILADPLLFLGAASHFYVQITGKKFMPTYMIPIGKVDLLPSARFALAPYGPEWYAEIFLKFRPWVLVIPYFRKSTGEFSSAWGAGIKFKGIQIVDKLNIGVGVHFFMQPEITHDHVASPPKDGELFMGFAAYIDITIFVSELFRITGRMGYKTDGYVFGMPLESGIIWYAGGIFHL